jgi:hypothetical protein
MSTRVVGGQIKKRSNQSEAGRQMGTDYLHMVDKMKLGF